VSAYVDQLRQHPPEAHSSASARRVGALHGYRWCHLIADSLDELLAFGKRVGMRATWLQGDETRGYHFDLVPPRREAALAAGAIEIDSRQLVAILKKMRRQQVLF
jgi:hypothetical protein